MNKNFIGFPGIIFLLCALLQSSYVFASKYTPEGIYEPEIYFLENDLRVVLNPRHGARNVAIRLDVGVGSFDFSCSKRETAHFLEHLLFTGTSKHTESELDDIMLQHGADWNAYTYNESTVYEIDIYSEHTNVALDTLSEIMTDSVIDRENFKRSKDIIYREQGGKPSWIRQFLYKHEIVSTAMHKSSQILLKGGPSYCSNMDTLEGIRLKDIHTAYDYFYVPNNMTLIIVGDFKTPVVKQQIENVFGSLKRKDVKHAIPRSDDFNGGPVLISSSFSPVTGESSETGLLFRTNGYDSPDYYSLLVIQAYLEKVLYENIRVDEGLTYAPAAELYESSNEGWIHLSAETTVGFAETVSMMMYEQVELLRDGKVSDDAIALTIESLLRNWARGLESNGSIADYYVDYLNEAKRFGRYIDQESYLETLSPDRVKAAGRRYLRDSNMAFILASPTFSYNQLYLIIGITIISLLILFWRLARKMHVQIRVVQEKKDEKGGG